MKKNNGKRDDFLRYRAGEMSDRERNAFEKELQRDPFAADAAEGFSLIDPGDVRSDLNKLEKRISIRTATRHLIFYSGVAAVVLLFIVSSVFFFRPAREIISGPPAVAEELSRKTDDSLSASEKVALASADTLTAKGDSVNRIAFADTLALKGDSVKRIASTEAGQIKEAATKTLTDALVAKYEYRTEVVAVERETLRTDTVVKAAGVARPLVVSPVDTAMKEAGVARPLMVISIDTALQLRLAEVTNITGIVTDEAGRPFPYVNVYLKGQTRIGVVTGEDGRFVLPVKPDTGIILVADFVGYKQLLVQADKSDLAILRMEPDMKALDEVIVVGFGEQRRTPVKTAARSKAQDQKLAEIILIGAITQIIPGDTLQPPHYIPPLPKGGYTAFHDYMKRNIKSPRKEEGLTVSVVEAGLPISSTGKKGTPLVVCSPGEWFSAEAVRLLTNGPEWAPAQRSGISVNDTIRIRITFLPVKRP